MRKALLPPARLQKLTVEGREQPGFHLRYISQLMALRRPNIKRLLRQIAGIGLHAREAEGKLIQRAIVTRHKAFKIQAHGVAGTVIIKTHETPVCSRQLAETFQPFSTADSPGDRKSEERRVGKECRSRW